MVTSSCTPDPPMRRRMVWRPKAPSSAPVPPTSPPCRRVLLPHPPMTLNQSGWAQVHRRFSPHHGQLLAEADRRVHALRAAFGNGDLPELPAGAPVQVHRGIQARKGHILRRGFGLFASSYRIKFEEGTDQWIQCWLCTEAEGNNLYG